MFVKDSMSNNPIVISPSTPILEALNIMKKNKIRQIPITERDKLVGLVSERELLMVTPSPASTLSIYEMNYLLAKMLVKDVMVKKPVTVEPNTTIEEAALIMRDNKLASLLVTENEKLVGIITHTDVFDQIVKIFGLRKAGTRIVIEAEDRIGALSDILEEVKKFNINLTGIAITEKSDHKVQIMLRLSTVEPAELVKSIELKGFKVTSVS